MTAMGYTRITVEPRGYVFLMGLNRPEKRNAFDLEMYEELTHAYGECEKLLSGANHRIGRISIPGHFAISLGIC